MQFKSATDTLTLLQSTGVGKAIVEALRLGLIKSRDELFITSKLWLNNAHHSLVLTSLQNSLKNLGAGVPRSLSESVSGKLESRIEGGFPIEKEDIVPMDYESVWEDMEECQKLGLTKSTGVSNFSCKKLEKLLAAAKSLLLSIN